MDRTCQLLVNVDTHWADDGVDQTARSWATANLASPHFAEVADVAKARIERTRRAVEERLNSEIRHWDLRAHELKEQELHGKKPRLNSGRGTPTPCSTTSRHARPAASRGSKSSPTSSTMHRPSSLRRWKPSRKASSTARRRAGA